MLYELLTGHPDRAPRELVFLADLTVELRAWPGRHLDQGRVDPPPAAAAVVASWRAGELPGLQFGGLSAQEVLALERPADRLRRQLVRADRRRRIPPGEAG